MASVLESMMGDGRLPAHYRTLCEHLGYSVLCSRVPWQGSEGVLAVSPASRTPSVFCPHWDLNRELSDLDPLDS